MDVALIDQVAWQRIPYPLRALPDRIGRSAGKGIIMALTEQQESALRFAADNGWHSQWEDDWEIGNHRAFYGADSAYSDSEPKTCEQCLLRDASENVVGALGCIDDASDDYRREVVADLVIDAMRELFAVKPIDAIRDALTSAGPIASVDTEPSAPDTLWLTFHNGTRVIVNVEPA